MALHFNAVDKDTDGFIDVNEVFDHFSKDKVIRFMHIFLTPVRFSKIDTNHDGQISPPEFYAQLSDQIISKFNALHM